jgi:flagellar P-ring protein precursor FlgI
LIKILIHITLILTSLWVLLFAPVELSAARIKDIASIEGNSTVQVIGYGLVTGLNQTGDNQQTSYTVQSVSNILKRFGLTIPTSNPRVRNVAAVMVTANIPAFSNRGSKIDVVVSSIGDATSLQGGVLLMTPISMSDGNIVGMAQGPVSIGGFDYRALGSMVSKNSTTTGRVPNGLILEMQMNSEVISNQQVNISLKEPDFTTATIIANAINSAGLDGLDADAAKVLDPGTVQVQLPAGQDVTESMQTIAAIETIDNIQSDPIAKVVINERTGTVVVGGNVELLPATIAHGGLEITIEKQVLVPQPAPFTIRPPQPAETAEISANEEVKKAIAINGVGANVQDMSNALNLLEVRPRDLIAIFQALKEAGSLQGELIIQ